MSPQSTGYSSALHVGFEHVQKNAKGFVAGRWQVRQSFGLTKSHKNMMLRSLHILLPFCRARSETLSSILKPLFL